MKELPLKKVFCTICGETMMAKKAQKNRCNPCRKKYLKDYQKLSSTKERRARQHRQLRERAFAGYGGRCVCCKENRFEFLALDHVNGGGRKDRETRSTQQIARFVVKNNHPDEFRVLCHNCNSAVGWYGTCPHQQ